MSSIMIPTNGYVVTKTLKQFGTKTFQELERFLNEKLTTIAAGLGGELDSSFSDHLERQGACVRIINLDDPGVEYHAPFGVINTQMRLNETMHNSHEKSVRLRSDYESDSIFTCSGWTAKPDLEEKSQRTYQGSVLFSADVSYIISISGYAAELDALLCLLIAEFLGLIESATSQAAKTLVYYPKMPKNKYLLAYEAKRELIRNANAN